MRTTTEKWKKLLNPINNNNSKTMLIEPQESLPTAFIRTDDGERMSLNEDGTYSWDYQKADPEHIIYKYKRDVMYSYVINGSFHIEGYTTKY